MELDEQGKRLLKLLGDQLHNFNRRDLGIFIGYQACHECRDCKRFCVNG